MGYISVGKDNSTSIDLYYEDHSHQAVLCRLMMLHRPP